MVERIVHGCLLRKRSAAIFAFAVFLAGAGGPALGQTTDTAEEGTSRAPTFAEVVENPDDTALVFRYAQHKIDQGELPAAAAALDQILLQRPDLHSVRVVYGVVLYRLGDLQSADAELKRADPDALPREIRLDRRRYLDKIARDQQTLRGEFTLSAGIAHETNAGAAPDSGDVLVLDTPRDVRGAEDDLAFSAGARLRLEHDLATSTPVTLWGQATGRARDYVEVDSQDLRYLFASTGARIRTLSLDFVPSVKAGVLTLSGERFYRFAGPELRVEYPLGGKAALFAHGGWFAESFDPIAESPVADDRSGQRLEGKAGVEAAPVPALRLKGYTQVTDKRAREDFWSYTGVRFVAEGTYRVFDDHFLLLRGTVGVRGYDAANPAVSATERDDTFYRIRLGYGLPIPGAERLAPELADLLVVPSVTYNRQTSNIRNFDYENITTAVMITKTFDF